MTKSLVNCLAIGAAGFLGALARYGIGIVFKERLSASGFPWHTLVINITGSAFLGWFYTVMGSRTMGPYADTIKLAIGIGFVGAYTTFSSYMFETNDMLRSGAHYSALAYLFGSLALGLIGVRLGVALGGWK